MIANTAAKGTSTIHEIRENLNASLRRLAFMYASIMSATTTKASVSSRMQAYLRTADTNCEERMRSALVSSRKWSSQMGQTTVLWRRMNAVKQYACTRMWAHLHGYTRFVLWLMSMTFKYRCSISKSTFKYCKNLFHCETCMFEISLRLDSVNWIGCVLAHKSQYFSLWSFCFFYFFNLCFSIFSNRFCSSYFASISLIRSSSSIASSSCILNWSTLYLMTRTIKLFRRCIS